MNDFIHDISYALRNLLRQRALSTLIVLTLALGIGVNTAMFSAAWQVLLAPLPYAEGDRLVVIEQQMPGRGRADAPWSSPTFADLQSQTNSFESMAGYQQQSLSMLQSGDAISALTGVVSANYFAVLGISPLLGRGFAAADEVIGEPPVMLLSQRFWVEAFNSDPAVIGTSVELSGLLVTIIGVLPPLPPWPNDNDIWVTHAANGYTVLASSNGPDNRDGYWFEHVLARMKPDTTFTAATEELDTIASRLEQSHPDIYLDDYALDATYLQQVMVGESRSTLLLLQAMTLLVLLIATANVSNFILVRLADRHQELAIREAIGASPRRLAWQILTESMLLALIGGSMGWLIAWGSLDLLQGFAAQYTTMASEIRLSLSSLLFALAITVFAGLLSGLTSGSARRDINLMLKEGGDKTTTSAGGIRKRQLFLVLQYSLAFMVLTSTGLVGLSLYRLASQDSGFDSEDVLAINMLVRVDMKQASTTFGRQVETFTRDLHARIAVLPGVSAVGFYGGLPLLENPLLELATESVEIEGGTPLLSATYAYTAIRLASASYFKAMNIPLRMGRFFDATDDKNAPKAAMVNARFAERYFPHGEALGRRVRFVPYGDEWWTIVGVVANVRSSSLMSEEDEMLYANYDQQPGDMLNLYVKASGDLDELARGITSIVRELAPTQPIDSIHTLDDVRRRSIAPARLRTLLVSLFGLLALAITLSGVIGIVLHHVQHRRRETGIRMAIGATPRRIVHLFLGASLRTYTCGLATGLVLMLLVAPLLEPVLYETSAYDITAYLASMVVLTTAVAVATYLPARKASLRKPVEALHVE